MNEFITWYKNNQHWIQWVFSGAGIVVITAIVGLVLRWKGSALSKQQQQERSGRHADDLASRNRRAMLEKVRAIWINGVLNRSLYKETLITLGLAERPDAVERPMDILVQRPDKADQQLPPGTRVVEVYDELGGELLILGSPGSGKTTLLLELARDLLDRAEQDDSHHIPVVFPCSDR